MAMFVWPDGTVTGSVNVEEKERIDAALKGLGKRQLAALRWPIESAAQVTDVPDTEPEPVPAPEPAPEAPAAKVSDTKKEKT